VASPLESLRRLSAASAGLLLTRAEFATVELAQARAQLMRWLGLALAACALAMLALAAGTGAVVVVLWPQWGWLTLLAFALAYGGLAAWLVLRIRREVRQAPPLLSQTLHELARDRDSLLGEAGPGR
jgi:uncharacterized membrane protein YqjE